MPLMHRLAERLGHPYKDEQLLKLALTHRSKHQLCNNERLEFLGDGLLNFIMAAELYRRYPTAREGELSRLRVELVKGSTLAELAIEYKVKPCLLLGRSELASGDFNRTSILADAFEAIVGSIYLDSDLETCRQCVLKWYESRLNTLTLKTLVKDPKTRLQEHLQAKGLALPDYEIVGVSGKGHKQTFKVRCRVADLKGEAQGEGRSRRNAEQQAAERYFDRLQQDEFN